MKISSLFENRTDVQLRYRWKQLGVGENERIPLEESKEIKSAPVLTPPGRDILPSIRQCVNDILIHPTFCLPDEPVEGFLNRIRVSNPSLHKGNISLGSNGMRPSSSIFEN